MFKEKNSKNILSDINNNMSEELDKREGSILYDFVAPFSKELAKKYILIDKVLLEGFASTQNELYLEKRAEESSIYRRKATNAKFLAKFTENVEINIGQRFFGAEFFYTVIEKLSDGLYILRSETIGVKGNEYIGKILPVTKVPNLTFGHLVSLYEEGKDSEDIEAFRKRYFDELINQYFTGSIFDYEKMLIEKYKIKNYKSYFNYAENVLNLVIGTIDDVEDENEYIVAMKNSLKNPIGHRLNIINVSTSEINISIKTILKSGYRPTDVYDEFSKKIDSYFNELENTFNTVENIIVRKSQIEILALSVNGIKDVLKVFLNGFEKNVVLNGNCIPLKGVVNIE